MAEPPTADVSTLLQRINAGDPAAQDRLMEVVYDDLRAIAGRHLHRQLAGRGDITIQPTVLVHECWLRLIKQRAKFDNRGQFFAIATKVMIRVLMDYAREKQAAKRGRSWVRVPLDPESPPADAASRDPADDPDADDSELSALVGAMERLETLDARKAEVVKLRVIWGLTNDEVAAALSVGRATVDRDWSFAKAWLRKELAEAAG